MFQAILKIKSIHRQILSHTRLGVHLTRKCLFYLVKMGKDQMLNLKTVLVLVLVLGENIELSRENVIMLTSFNFSK